MLLKSLLPNRRLKKCKIFFSNRSKLHSIKRDRESFLLEKWIYWQVFFVSDIEKDWRVHA